MSNFKYPLINKIKLVNSTIKNIPDKDNFSLYYSGDVLLAGGGWTSLFTYRGYTPVSGNLSLYWGHVYESYGLYPKPFATTDPSTVVILSSIDNKPSSVIYNNNKGKFNYKIDIEGLYQPKYFND
jgi:hypothetical protein